MAGRQKKTVEESVDSLVKDKNENSSTEMDLLKKENDELKIQLKTILEKLSTLEKQEKSTVFENDNAFEQEDNVETYKEINPLKTIKVVSLSDGGVSLKTTANGSGKSFRFDKFGHSISITYTDLQDVIAVNRSFIEDGVVYICDADVVKNNYLDEFYTRFLTAEKISNILSFNKSDIVDMVTNTTEAIQETIISLIIKKINNNEYVDMNKVEAIGKSCKIPCDIPALALQKRIK